MSGPARTVTHSVATMSWIDPNANLPERDVFNWNRNTPANRAILLGKSTTASQIFWRRRS